MSLHGLLACTKYGRLREGRKSQDEIRNDCDHARILSRYAGERNNTRRLVTFCTIRIVKTNRLFRKNVPTRKQTFVSSCALHSTVLSAPRSRLFIISVIAPSRNSVTRTHSHSYLHFPTLSTFIYISLHFPTFLWRPAKRALRTLAGGVPKT